MKKILSTVFILAFISVIITGCQDRSNLTAPAPQSPKSGSADFTRFVTIGNSITAGYQSSALYQSAQVWSYGNQIAKLVNTTYQMPLVSDPGLGGRLVLQSLVGPVIVSQPSSGVPLNSTYPYPYNNLGIPGAQVYDVLNAKDSLTCYSAKYFGQPNPFFNLVLRNGVSTQFQQAKALQPTMVTCWIGNNDALTYATNGGYPSALLTPAGTFDALYRQVGDSLASLGAKVAVANIPEVTTIPFFTTIGPVFAKAFPWTAKGVKNIYFAAHESGLPYGAADSIHLATLQTLITLKGQGALAYIGDVTGAYYSVNHITVPAGVVTAYPFGLYPLNPFPDQYVLDSTEIVSVHNAITAFNGTIASVATAKGFALVDIHTTFNNIFLQSVVENGYFNYTGVNFTALFITGGLFSLDGVHPTSQGQGLIADEFIKAINQKFGANYPTINLATIPGSLNFAKRNFTSNFSFNVYNWNNLGL